LLDLKIILPFGCLQQDLVKSIIYTDDLDLLMKMFWWTFYCLSTMGFPVYLVDIIHSGLSDRHQEHCINDFRNGHTTFLLGSSKISAGMDFPDVQRVIQYKVCGLTLVSADQHRGRGGHCAGLNAVGIFLVEPGMQKDGGLSVENPGAEDPGILDLVQADDTCCNVIFVRHLENPPHPHDPLHCCCN
jgi:Lhr-like helicase